MIRKNKVAILAIGTEVTSGQIVNKNSAWLSEQMERLGFESVLHLSVPDEDQLIQNALRICADHAEFIFTTGGLGPTTDDFSRESISKFLNLKLILDENSWKKIAEKMHSMNRPLLQSQKQQCYFPENSVILDNGAGTANGFFVATEDFKISVLPGPPVEVLSIWEHQLKKIISKYAVSGMQPILKRWNCMGAPEAELAERVEEAVKTSRLKTGYRLNAPYVEIKLWCNPNELDDQKPFIAKVESAIQNWIVLTDDEDPWKTFWLHLKDLSSVEICDEASEGLLAHRLSTFLRSEKIRTKMPKLVIQTTHSYSISPQTKTDFFLHLFPLQSNGEFEIEIRKFDKSIRLKRKSPFLHSLENERSRLAAAELAILESNKFLS